MDRGAWWATIHGGHKELDRLSNSAKPQIINSSVVDLKFN